MHVAVGEGGDIHLVILTKGFIVVETGAPLHKEMIKPGAEQAWSFELEPLGDFVAEEGEEAVEKEQDDHQPFEDGVDE